jgi:propanediol dehydratase small subunit
MKKEDLLMQLEELLEDVDKNYDEIYDLITNLTDDYHINLCYDFIREYADIDYNYEYLLHKLF